MDRVIAMEVKGYQIRRGGETLGAVGTGNAVLLNLTFDSAWDGMVKTAKFTDARGDGGVTTEIELLTQNADGSYTVAVPREAMAYEGTAELTLIGEITEGTAVTKRLTTKPLPLRVCASGADREAQNTQPITATDKQQIMAKIDAAEAYAKGTVNGTAVSEGEPGWQDNAAYYKNLAEDAATAAETAQSLAENAQNAAEDAQSAAESAQNLAESAQTAAEEARDLAVNAVTEACSAADDAAESAAAALDAQDAIASASDLLEDLADGRYAAFASETQRNVKLLHTDIGADGLPLLQMTLDFFAGEESEGNFHGFTLRHCGKNLLDCSAAGANPGNGTKIYRGLTFSETNEGFRISGTVGAEPFTRSSLIGLAAYPIGVPVFAGVTYSFSCGVAQSIGDIPSASLSPEKIFLRIRYANNTYSDVANGGSITPLLNGYVELVKSADTMVFSSGTQYLIRFTPQLEIGPSCSAFETYSGTDHAVSLSGTGAPAYIGAIDLLSGSGEDDIGQAIACTPLALCTKKGINCFYVLPRNRIPEDHVTLSGGYRVDPTMAFDKLKAAIVAAGTN